MLLTGFLTHFIISKKIRFKCPFYEVSAKIGQFQDIEMAFQSIVREIKKSRERPIKIQEKEKKAKENKDVKIVSQVWPYQISC